MLSCWSGCRSIAFCAAFVRRASIVTICSVGSFRASPTRSREERDQLQPRLHSIAIPFGAAAIDKTLDELKLMQFGVEVTAVRRRNVRNAHPDPQMRLLVEDVIVLRGTEESLAAAEMRLLQG